MKEDKQCVMGQKEQGPVIDMSAPDADKEPPEQSQAVIIQAS